jgi:hypothetical protein
VKYTDHRILSHMKHETHDGLHECGDNTERIDIDATPLVVQGKQS